MCRFKTHDFSKYDWNALKEELMCHRCLLFSDFYHPGFLMRHVTNKHGVPWTLFISEMGKWAPCGRILFFVMQLCDFEEFVIGHGNTVGGNILLRVGAIYYEVSITAEGLPEPSSLRVVHWVPEQLLNIKAVTVLGHAIWLMVATLRYVRPQVQWYHLAYATEIKSIQLHDSIKMSHLIR